VQILVLFKIVLKAQLTISPQPVKTSVLLEAVSWMQTLLLKQQPCLVTKSSNKLVYPSWLKLTNNHKLLSLSSDNFLSRDELMLNELVVGLAA